MIETAIKKPGGIGNLLNSYTPGQIEVEKKQKITGTRKFASLLRSYERIVNGPVPFQYPYAGSSTDYPLAFKRISAVLAPEDIDLFLQSTIGYENLLAYERATGLFITKLIQNAFDAGHQNFFLNVHTIKPLDFLGSFLHGTAEQPISLTIDGDCDDFLARYAKYVTMAVNGNVTSSVGYQAEDSSITISGNAGDIGGEGKDSVVTVHGNVGRVDDHILRGTITIYGNVRHCGNYAQSSTFTIHGDVDKVGVEPQDCTFILYGQVDQFLFKARNCTYKVKEQTTLEKLLRYVDRQKYIGYYNNKWNRVYHIHPDGTEEVYRK